MNKFTKGILSLGIALSILAGATGVTAFAANYQSATVAGYGVVCKSDIKYSTATAYTTYGNYASVSVESTYRYCNTSTGVSGRKSNGTGSNKSASLSFKAPSNNKSVSISSTHKVSAGGQYWSTNTFDDKEA